MGRPIVRDSAGQGGNPAQEGPRGMGKGICSEEKGGRGTKRTTKGTREREKEIQVDEVEAHCRGQG